jgi:hypothetical protein
MLVHDGLRRHGGGAKLALAGDNPLLGTWRLKLFVRQDARDQRTPAGFRRASQRLSRLRARWAHVRTIRRRRPRSSRWRPANRH